MAMRVFLDSFGLRRRTHPRVQVHWTVDIHDFSCEKDVDFQARDVSLFGIRLQGATDQVFKQLLSEKGRVTMRLHVPDQPNPLSADALLLWGMGPNGRFLTGWKFTAIARATSQVLRAYIANHPQDVIQRGL